MSIYLFNCPALFGDKLNMNTEVENPTVACSNLYIIYTIQNMFLCPLRGGFL